MKNTNRAILTGILFLVLIVAGCQAVGTEIGERAPDFELRDLDKQLVSLSDFRGQPVLLNFWATWCEPCRREIHYLQQVNKEWLKKGLVMLAVNVGERQATVEGFLRANSLNLPVLLDTGVDVFIMYNTRSLPTTFFIDKDGIIQDKVFSTFPNKEAIEQRLSMIIE